MDVQEQAGVSRRRAIKLSVKTAIGGAIACVAATPSEAGYGACSKCSCRGFIADYRNNNVCSNCGDSYGDHW